MSVRVGLLDSGVAEGLAQHVVAAEAFTGEALTPDRLGHGTTLAAIVLHHVPQATLYNAQVFGDRRVTAPKVVADGLRWLAEMGVQIVNMSFGLRDDRATLRQAVAAARSTGMILVAAAPARGAAAFPGAYPGVIRVTGDARCEFSEISALAGTPADFGGCPLGLDGRPGGASPATAHVTGLLAGHLEAGLDDPVGELERTARFRGRERRTC